MGLINRQFVDKHKYVHNYLLIIVLLVHVLKIYLPVYITNSSLTCSWVVSTREFMHYAHEL